MMESNASPIEGLLLEDSPSDVRLTREGLAEAKVRNRISVGITLSGRLYFMLRALQRSARCVTVFTSNQNVKVA